MQALTTCPRETVSWVNVNGVPVQEGEGLSSGDWEDVLLRLRDPNTFVAGGIHANPTAWEVILSGYPAKVWLLNWIRNKVDIFEFRESFSGVYKNSQYCSDLPPAKRFPSHGSCDNFTDFICEEILKRVSSGAVRVWGRVGMVSPPHLVLPLTVEPTKARLCVDARFLNLSMKDAPFSLDKVTDVPRYVYRVLI